MIALIHHPTGKERLGDLLLNNLAQPKWHSFRAAIAFLKKSGTKHVCPGLKRFAKRGTVKLSIGIDHNGTSFEGLRELLSSLGKNGEAYIFHNEARSTFHPKIYLFHNDTDAECFIGSGNLTQGGLFTNCEAFVHLRLNRNDREDSRLLANIEELLDEWSDLSLGCVRRLTVGLTTQLHEAGLVPTEKQMREAEKKIRSVVTRGTSAKQARKLFAAVKFKRAPRVVATTKRARRAAKKTSAATALTFVMTLQKTDVGVGQVTAGTSKRSPEIFIPMLAVREQPAFWGWPNLFKPDPNWTKKKDAEGRGKMDRNPVKMLLNGEILDVHWWYNPDKIDIRLRNSKLRGAGKIGDIIRIEKPSRRAPYDYSVRIVRPTAQDFRAHLALCSTAIRKPSKKRYGYF